MTGIQLKNRLDKWIEELDARQSAMEKALRGLRLLRDQVDVIGWELVDSMAESIYSQVAPRQPSLFDDAPVEPSPPEPNAAEPPKSDRTHREMVIDFFMANKNRPASNIEIRTALGLSRGAVAVVLYHKDTKFEQMPKDSRGKALWRLRAEEYETRQEFGEGEAKDIKPPF